MRSLATGPVTQWTQKLSSQRPSYRSLAFFVKSANRVSWTGETRDAGVSASTMEFQQDLYQDNDRNSKSVPEFSLGGDWELGNWMDVDSSQENEHTDDEMAERIADIAERIANSSPGMSRRQFSHMIRSGRVRITRSVAISILRVLTGRSCWRKALEFVKWLSDRDGHTPRADRHVFTTLMAAIAKERPSEVLPIIHIMREKVSTWPDMVAYQVAARSLGRAGRLSELLDLAAMMRAGADTCRQEFRLENWNGIVLPDVGIYNQILNASVSAMQWQAVDWVMDCLQRDRLSPNSATYGLAIQVMARCGRRKDAWKLLQEMEGRGFAPNSRTYRALIALEDSAHGGHGLVQEMERRGVVGHAGVYAALGQALCREGKWQEAMDLLQKIESSEGSESGVKTMTGFIHACFRGGHYDACLALFRRMQQQKGYIPNLGTYNSMIQVYARLGHFDEAMRMYGFICRGQTRARLAGNEVWSGPDRRTFEAMLTACVNGRRWREASSVLHDMEMNGWQVQRDRHGWMLEHAIKAGGGGIFASRLRVLLDLYEPKVSASVHHTPAEAAGQGGGGAVRGDPAGGQSTEESTSRSHDEAVSSLSSSAVGREFLRRIGDFGLLTLRSDGDVWKYAICCVENRLRADLLPGIKQEMTAVGFEADSSVYSHLIRALLYNGGGTMELEHSLSLRREMEQAGGEMDVGVYAVLVRKHSLDSNWKAVIETHQKMKEAGMEADPRTRALVETARSKVARGGKRGYLRRHPNVAGEDVPSVSQIIASW